MKIAFKINWILVTLLSISTGVFKILQQQADIEMFEAIGMNANATLILGVFQLLGGILLVPLKTRKLGAWIMIPTFILASVAVFVNQMYVFGAVSILFILMAYFVTIQEKTSKIKTD